MPKRSAREYIEPFVHLYKIPPVEFMPVIRNVRIVFPFADGEEILIDHAFVDTGADYSALPKDEFAFLAGDPRFPKIPCSVQDSSGQTTAELMIPVKFQLPTVMEAPRELDILIFGTEYLIGRDILCNFVVQLDGPARELRIRKTRR